MDKITVRVEIIESDGYSTSTITKVEAMTRIDEKADIRGEVSEQYTNLANKAAREIVRELESDDRLNKSLRGEPCCPEFKKHMEAGKFDGAKFCRFCGKAISKDLDEKAMAMVGVAF